VYSFIRSHITIRKLIDSFSHFCSLSVRIFRKKMITFPLKKMRVLN